ncbi:hypothetical protein D6853_10225 [Butyrivibrio sp. X503]|nr:hypothetical protein D6853_10225 [Butyrivibrio sp. X503]
MSSYSDYDNLIVSDERWQDFFLRNYIQSMFDGYDYKKKILKEQDGLMTKTQIEYINYSLTGEYAIFDSLENEKINCLESQNSPLVAYTITNYEYEEQGESIVLKADADFFKKGSKEEKKFVITAVLERNPYSCFDGYSIVSIKTEDVTEYEHGDEAAHKVKVYFSGDDYVMDKGLVGVEYVGSEDGVEYEMLITVHVTDEQMQYMLENKHKNFEIAYVYDKNTFSPVSTITATSVELDEAEIISSENVFFDGTKTVDTYEVTDLLDEAVSEVEVKTEKIAEYDSGEVYSISIGYESPEISGTDKGDRLNLGRFLVTKDNIYLMLEENGTPSEEEFFNDGIVVASDDDYSKIIGEVYQVEITHEDDKCIFAMWNTAIESGWYCHYEWVKGRGLTYYRSGYGAGRDAIEITNS